MFLELIEVYNDEMQLQVYSWRRELSTFEETVALNLDDNWCSKKLDVEYTKHKHKHKTEPRHEHET